MAIYVLIISQALYLGFIYGILGTGLTITYAATKVVNFAQGEYFVLGAAVAYQMQTVLRQPLWLVALAVIILSAVLGLVTERLIMWPVQRSGIHFAWIISTVAVALILESIYSKFFQSAVLRPAPVIPGTVVIFGQAIQIQIFVIIGVAIALMIAYESFLSRSIYGSAVRATAHDPETASSFGINVKSVIRASFVISSIVTALIGMLGASILFVGPTDGLNYTINGFIAMVLGGLGSTRGAIVGGLIAGILNAIIVNLVNANFGEIVVVSVLALVLVVRPNGLFARPVEGH